MQINIIKSYRDVIAICDTELLGKTFRKENPDNREQTLMLDVKETFYKGTEKTPEEILQEIINHKREDATFNIVGKESIAVALEAGLILPEGVKEIEGIPFALVLL